MDILGWGQGHKHFKNICLYITLNIILTAFKKAVLGHQSFLSFDLYISACVVAKMLKTMKYKYMIGVSGGRQSLYTSRP